MKIGIIGSGIVAKTLGSGFIKHGHEVALGTRDVAKLADWKAKNPGAREVGFSDAAAFGEVVIFAVPGAAALDVLKLVGAHVDGKTVIDATNPVGSGPPVNGVLSFFTSLTSSLMERLQQASPNAHFVKAFNSVGVGQMVRAKKVVEGLLDQFGWETEDMGAVEAARAIEPLCMLWCIPGVGRNDWSPHAFKLLR
jgi:8-hydroxy-5-deazaflavin:NADPH oxidoreductase